MPRRRPAGGGGRPGHLALHGAPSLPPLNAVPDRLVVYERQARLVDLAQAMVRAGAAGPEDWDPENPAPGRMIERAVERLVRRINRRLPDVMPICAFVRPWEDVLDELFADAPVREPRWVLGLDSSNTHRLPVAPLLEAFGEDGTALILHRLMRHTPFCTEGPDDLEWIIDGWYHAGSEPGPEAKEIARRAESATELGKRINLLLGRGYSLPLQTLQPGVIRRLLGVLEALDRSTPQANDTAWRETDEVEWSLPQPVIHLIWQHGCPIDHAVDEAEFLNGQDGSHPMPQQMWLLDPTDLQDATRSWSRWLHSLAQTSVTSRLLHQLERISARQPS